MTASATETVCPVIVLARAPQPGKAKTRLIPALGKAGAAALHRRLVLHCLRAAADARIGPVELWCTPDTSDPFFRECRRSLGVSLHARGGGGGWWWWGGGRAGVGGWSAFGAGVGNFFGAFPGEVGKLWGSPAGASPRSAGARSSFPLCGTWTGPGTSSACRKDCGRGR